MKPLREVIKDAINCGAPLVTVHPHDLATLLAAEPIGTLWQHGETGRKQVEFADEPRTVMYSSGWYCVGSLYLDPLTP